MNLLNFFARKSSAPVARERLQLLLAHERSMVGQSDLIAILREEILAVIAKHVRLDPEGGTQAAARFEDELRRAELGLVSVRAVPTSLEDVFIARVTQGVPA